MAQVSIVNKSELEGATRVDAEYYKPIYLKYKHQLAKYQPLGEFIVSIMHPVELKRVYEDEGLRIILAQNVRRNMLDLIAALSSTGLPVGEWQAAAIRYTG